MQSNLALVCQIIALICFALAGLNMIWPRSPRTSWNFFAWAWFFVLLSLMIGHANMSLGLHPVGGS
jgi:hypothetical protein